MNNSNIFSRLHSTVSNKSCYSQNLSKSTFNFESVNMQGFGTVCFVFNLILEKVRNIVIVNIVIVKMYYSRLTVFYCIVYSFYV